MRESVKSIDTKKSKSKKRKWIPINKTDTIRTKLSFRRQKNDEKNRISFKDEKKCEKKSNESKLYTRYEKKIKIKNASRSKTLKVLESFEKPSEIISPWYRTCCGCFKEKNVGRSVCWDLAGSSYILWICSNRCERNVYFKKKIDKIGIACCHCYNFSLDRSIDLPCLFCKKRNRDPVFVGFQKKSKKHAKEYEWLECILKQIPNDIKELET